MSQNRSSAVMQQRHEPPDSLDFFPTPPWATRALCEWMVENHNDWDSPLSGHHCLEPACGEGHMARVLEEYFETVSASDCHEYGFGTVGDFLFPVMAGFQKADWVITNPPFRLGAKFARMGLRQSRHGVALLVRTAFLEGGTRWLDLYSKDPPTWILQFAGRVVMLRGRLVSPDWRNPETGNKYSTATAYCWLVWMHGELGGLTRFHWLPPWRKRWERPGDYGKQPLGKPAPVPLLEGQA